MMMWLPLRTSDSRSDMAPEHSVRAYPQWICISYHRPIHPLTHPSIHLSVHPSIHPSSHPSFHPINRRSSLLMLIESHSPHTPRRSFASISTSPLPSIDQSNHCAAIISLGKQTLDGHTPLPQSLNKIPFHHPLTNNQYLHHHHTVDQSTFRLVLVPSYLRAMTRKRHTTQ